MQPPSGAERAPRSRLRAARPPGEAGFDFPRRGAEGSGACGVERLGRPRCPQAPGTKARWRLGKGRAGCCSLPGFGSARAPVGLAEGRGGSYSGQIAAVAPTHGCAAPRPPPLGFPVCEMGAEPRTRPLGLSPHLCGSLGQAW